jgi:hypothetical protein
VASSLSRRRRADLSVNSHVSTSTGRVMQSADQPSNRWRSRGRLATVHVNSFNAQRRPGQGCICCLPCPGGGAGVAPHGWCRSVVGRSPTDVVRH